MFLYMGVEMVINLKVAVVLLLMTIIDVNANTDELAITKALYTKLFQTDGYNKFIRPIKTQTDVLDVTSQYTISCK